jgi:hypothetical protein
MSNKLFQKNKDNKDKDLKEKKDKENNILKIQIKFSSETWTSKLPKKVFKVSLHLAEILSKLNSEEILKETLRDMLTSNSKT